MIGIYDFSYGHYALGDALTWTMNVNVRATEAGADADALARAVGRLVDEPVPPGKLGFGFQARVHPPLVSQQV
jgi:hypothetical protein